MLAHRENFQDTPRRVSDNPRVPIIPNARAASFHFSEISSRPALIV